MGQLHRLEVAKATPRVRKWHIRPAAPVGNNGQRCYFELLLGLERVCFCDLGSLIPRTSAQGSLVAFFWSGTFFIADL